MKINIILFITAVFLICCLGACGRGSAGSSDETADTGHIISSENKADSKGSDNTGQAAGKDGKSLQIVTTIFPEYDWVQNILGEQAAGAEVSMLLDNGVDLHSFQPTAEDILKIGTCDMFIYVGGESDSWVEDALAEAVNKDMVVINLLDVLGNQVKEEKIVEGMEGEV